LNVGEVYSFKIKAKDPLGNTYSNTDEMSLTLKAPVNLCTATTPPTCTTDDEEIYTTCLDQCSTVGDVCVPKLCCDFPSKRHENSGETPAVTPAAITTNPLGIHGL